jgi:hypothetical protein
VASAVGDFNNDGQLDIVVTNQASDNVTVLLNSEKSHGDFEPGINSSVGSAGKNPVSAAVADFNHDGNLDVVVANPSTNKVTVLLGDGTGHFSSSASYSVGSNPSSVAVGDFNKDTWPDIAVTNAGDGTVTVLLNNGSSGGFTPDTGSPYAVGSSPSAVAAADFNQDGYPDLVVANAGEATASVLINNGISGGFATQQKYAVGNGPSAVVAAKFGRSKYPDFAVANQTDGTVSVLLNNGSTGGFTPATGSPYNVSSGSQSSQPVAIVAANFDGDGYNGIATANKADGTVAVLSHCTGKKCGGTFHASAQFTTVGSNPVAMAVGDFAVVGNHDPGTLFKAGYAYNTMYDWLVGNTISTACNGPVPALDSHGHELDTKGVWTCGITGDNGYQAQLVWYMDETYKTGCSNNVCVTVPYSVPSGYNQYRTAYQPDKYYQIQNGTVNIGYIPILLENHSPSRHNAIVRRKIRTQKQTP